MTAQYSEVSIRELGGQEMQSGASRGS